MVMLNAAIFYACSATIITLLLLLARHNRKTGWRRNHNKDEWLAARQLYADYLLAPPLAPTPPVEAALPELELFSEQLLAMGAALAAMGEPAIPTRAAAEPATN